MKKLMLIICLISFNSLSLELYDCKFSSKISSNKGHFVYDGNGVVFVDGNKFAAHNNGNYAYRSPNLSDDRNNVLLGKKDVYIYALSKDKTNYAVLLDGSEIAYQWDQCVLYKKIDMDKGFFDNKLGNYVPKIKEYVNEQLIDPYSAKYSDFSKPKKNFAISKDEVVKGYSVCFKVNAKNSFGGYVGKKQEWVFFQGNKIVASSDRTGRFIEKWFDVNCDK